MHGSNLVSFEDSLRASPSAFDAVLLREVRSGAVDLALDRHPAELLLRDYLQVLAGLRTISASADGDTLMTFPYTYMIHTLCIVQCVGLQQHLPYSSSSRRVRASSGTAGSAAATTSRIGKTRSTGSLE